MRSGRSPAAASRKRDVPDGLWLKCSACSEIVNTPEMLASLWVCNSCGYHMQVGGMDRISMLMEESSFTEWDETMRSIDILGRVPARSSASSAPRSARATAEEARPSVS